MEKERGIVEQVERQKATVRVQRSSHCASCKSRGQCHTMGESEMRVEIVNTLCAKEGDLVEIALPTRSLLKLSILVYLAPILMLLIGAFLGQAWAETSSLDPTLASVIGGIAAMGLSFMGLKWLDGRMRGKAEYSPRLLKILTSAESLECDGNR